jgi:light-regulated signal transduction histidine kinase (bacteriophytochrome)
VSTYYRKKHEPPKLVPPGSISRQSQHQTMTKHIEIEALSHPPEAAQPMDAAHGTDGDLRRRNAVLEQRVEELGAQLRSAQAETDLLAQAISHDLRSPITVIGGFTELLAKHSGKALDEKGTHYLDMISESTCRIGKMLDEILALSRMSQSEMHVVPIDLEALVRRVVQDLDAAKGDRRVEWMIGSLPTVHADPTILRQAITKFAGNALKFTRSRDVARIRIGVQGTDPELIFSVRDNASGFDIKQRERMFGLYKNLESPAAPGASTMGLAYVQRIIQRHGGRAWAEADPDGGATFYFSLPNHTPEHAFRHDER